MYISVDISTISQYRDVECNCPIFDCPKAASIGRLREIDRQAIKHILNDGIAVLTESRQDLHVGTF